MIYPLSWLAEYVKLPRSLTDLTDRLTMAGHMLDKKQTVGEETLIDLELRGNRPDLLGVYGLSREISACFEKPLKPLPVATLPKTDARSKLVTVKAPELVERFTALTIRVEVRGSPDWLKKRLSYFGIPSVNNVVDITNYCMLETGEPMHSFDLENLTGKRLILRSAHPGETMTTFQGTEAKLQPGDLVVSDLVRAQALTMIGSRGSGTTFSTKTILLEAAVYKYANVRHTGRRLGLHTEAATRHEKILDPNQVPWALSRALLLLTELASAQVLESLYDFYPEKKSANSIFLPSTETARLTGLTIPDATQAKILTSLGCQLTKKASAWQVKAPTFRTDLEQPADLVEEITRIYGYNKIPVADLPSANQFVTDPYPKFDFGEKTRDALINLSFNEIISSSLIANSDPTVGPASVRIVNPPDTLTATLRPGLLSGLSLALRQAQAFHQQNLNFFELGQVFTSDKKGRATEGTHLAFIGPAPESPDQKDYAASSGYLTALFQQLKKEFRLSEGPLPQYLDAQAAAVITDHNGTILGHFGLINSVVRRELRIPQPVYFCEISIDKLLPGPQSQLPSYYLYPSYPPVYEDLTFEVTSGSQVGSFCLAVKKISPLVKAVKLRDVYQNFWTLSFTYQDAKKSLSSADTKPLREQIIRLAQSQYRLKLQD